METASDGFRQWKGQRKYAAAHYVELPVSAAAKTQTGGVVTRSLDREIRNYENPVPGFQKQKEKKELFDVERKFLQIYHKKIKKEPQRVLSSGA